MKNGLWNRFVRWLRKTLKIYQREAKMLVDFVLEDVWAKHVKSKEIELTDLTKRKIKNKVLANIIIMGLDSASDEGKIAVRELMHDAIDEFVNGNGE